VPIAPVVSAARRAAQTLARRLEQSEHLTLHLEPELDIVTYLAPGTSLTEIDANAAAMLQAGMDDPDDPVFLSTLQRDADDLLAMNPGLKADAARARILRSVLMKPEHEAAVDWLATRLEDLSRAAPAGRRTRPGG
jgi:hypothetical protein